MFLFSIILRAIVPADFLLTPHFLAQINGLEVRPYGKPIIVLRFQSSNVVIWIFCKVFTKHHGFSVKNENWSKMVIKYRVRHLIQSAETFTHFFLNTETEITKPHMAILLNLMHQMKPKNSNPALMQPQ